MEGKEAVQPPEVRLLMNALYGRFLTGFHKVTGTSLASTVQVIIELGGVWLSVVYLSTEPNRALSRAPPSTPFYK